MASNASSSDPASPTAPESQRPQAGPLPTKRGEIGYQENLHAHLHESRSSSPTTSLPSRHPADRGASLEENDTSSSSPNPDPSTTTTTNNNNNPPSTPSPDSSQKSRRFFRIFKKNGKPSSIRGLCLTTLLAFIFQLIILGGTISIWVLTSRRLGAGLVSNAIFIHAIFAVAAVGQLLFLERRLYRLRAERYNYLHPGEILPSSRHHREMRTNPVIAFSPWNRPPLPTYAAALAQSGVGTGDVEDHLIAAPPPPAYGNTRGSILLLSGFLRESLRGQRPTSGQSSVSGREGGNGDRPVSSASHTSLDEFVEDAERARRLDETLSRLERHSSRASRTSRGPRTSFV